MTILTQSSADERRPTATAPIVCPPWCTLGPTTSAEHGGSPRAVAHRTDELLLRRPANQYGDNILARAELFQLDEEGEAPSPAVVYMRGETDVVIDNTADLDAFITDAEAFVDSLRAMRARLAAAQAEAWYATAAEHAEDQPLTVAWVKGVPDGIMRVDLTDGTGRAVILHDEDEMPVETVIAYLQQAIAERRAAEASV